MTKKRVVPGLCQDEQGEPVLEAGRVTKVADLVEAAQNIRKFGPQSEDASLLLRLGGAVGLADETIARALKTEEGIARLADFVSAVTEVNRDHAVLWWDDERHAADQAALALALHSREQLPLFGDFLRSNDLDHEVEQGTHLDQVVAAHGWSEETIALAALRATNGSGQHGQEQVVGWATSGLRQALLETEALADAFIEACHAEARSGPSYLSFRRRLTPGDGEAERFERLLERTLEFRYEPVARAVALVLGADSRWAARLRQEHSEALATLKAAGQQAQALCSELEALARDEKWDAIIAQRSRLEAARPLASRAMATVSLALLMKQDVAAAADFCAEALEDTPVNPSLLNNALKACADAGAPARGIELWEQAQHRLEEFTSDERKAMIVGKLIACYWFANRIAEGYERLEPCIQALKDERDQTFLLNAACLYVWKGRTDEALDFVRRGLVAGIPVGMFDGDDAFDPIRELPAFIELLATRR